MYPIFVVLFCRRKYADEDKENKVSKRFWIISYVLCVLFLLGDGILFCVALATPTWKGPWGRYLAKVFLIGAAVFGVLGTVLLIVYLMKKR